MRLISVNVGRPRPLGRIGENVVVSAIGKTPVPGRVKVRRLNLEGDRQADRRVHGGETKAVYVYPGEHYPFWQARFPDLPLPWGSFGENFTTEGLLETEVRIGDELRVGSARFGITQPRTPCYKLGMKFGTEQMVRWFHEAQRPGFYLRVLEEGEVGAGDAIELRAPRPSTATVLEEYLSA